MNWLKLAWTILTCAAAHRAGPVPASAESRSNLHVELVGDGMMRLLSDHYEVIWPDIGFGIQLRQGDQSDGYSIPRLVWFLVGHPYGQRSMTSAFVHDILCNRATCYEERVIADAVFFALLGLYQEHWLKQRIFYIGVRFWGRYMWLWKNRKAGK